ncbi:MAG: hypothetical protein Q8P50_18955 [Bacillota bacterium]|nr:hypothetical protein [Bacillota bacterium]
MLAGRGKLMHPTCGEVALPLLVPAFTSKGFDLRRHRNHLYSEIVFELEEFGRRPQRSTLVSAYDMHFGHLCQRPSASTRRDLLGEAHLRNTTIVVVDSGGYELSPSYDSSEPEWPRYQPRGGYGPAEYEQVLERLANLHPPLPMIITNFDHGARGLAIAEQVSRARTLFRKFRNVLTSFILKPWTKGGKVVTPRDMSSEDFGNLRGFDVVGITEKELGKNLMDRLKAVAVLRRGLTSAGIDAPIHIWGGLDPIMTPLFFFAGAQVFDGVSWLRYAYWKGVAIHRNCHALLSDLGVTESYAMTHAHASMTSLSFLNKLTIALEQWVDCDGKRFDMFEENVRQYLKTAFLVMKIRISEISEAAR